MSARELIAVNIIVIYDYLLFEIELASKFSIRNYYMEMKRYYKNETFC